MRSTACPTRHVASSAGDPATRTYHRVLPCRNVAGSSKLYTVDPKDHLLAERDAEGRGLEIIGVMHSHTHTEPYPSPTDVAQAPDPEWHYLIVSLKQPEPVFAPTASSMGRSPRSRSRSKAWA